MVGTSISLVGDGIGHLMQLVPHGGNTSPNNVLVLPTCFVIPALMVILLTLYHRRGVGVGAGVSAAAPHSQG